MIEFQDSRASALVDKIRAIYNTKFNESCVTISDETVLEGLVDEVRLDCAMLHHIIEQIDLQTNAVFAEQTSHQISGIEWYTVEYQSISVKLPCLHLDLKLMPGDKEILIQSKALALDFLLNWNQSLKIWRYDKQFDYHWHQLNWAEFYAQYLDCEWIKMWVSDSKSEVIDVDGVCVERPTSTINVYCYRGDPMSVRLWDAYSNPSHIWFQWSNSIPHI